MHCKAMSNMVPSNPVKHSVYFNRQTPYANWFRHEICLHSFMELDGTVLHRISDSIGSVAVLSMAYSLSIIYT